MLSEQTLAIVKATVPVLEQHGETLTRHFYQRMFTHSPEVAPLFNPAHQTAGTQQKALAAAICEYAKHIENPGVLGKAIELIAQKHASLRVKPEHYPIVGTHLLASIREVLGEAATDEVIAAWGEAYHFLANVLLKREGQIYQAQAATPQGWEGFRSFKVVNKVKENDIITSFYLSPADEGGIPKFYPGQYITVRLATPDGSTTMRNYSLSDSPNENHFRISVKRQSSPLRDVAPGFVSNTLHDAIKVGMCLDVAPPCGEFILDPETAETRPLVFLAAGVGITPLLSMLKAALAAAPQRQITFIHACRHEGVQAFKDTLDEWAAHHTNLSVHHCYSEQPPAGVLRDSTAISGLLTDPLLTNLIPFKEADYYFCGPTLFMQYIHRHLMLKGVAPERMHYEFFGPKQEWD